ncbi:MAG: NUDIX hydrolase [Lachnospiraceae bacterium]|nr:NUDIX hydrolase [Lachnospiraceae bacterium]
MNEKDELFEKQISSKEVYKGKLLWIFEDQVTLPNGQTASREIMKHNGASAIVPITKEGNVIMERQFRYPFGRIITEIPAGKLDGPEEDRLEAAKRELKEETGITADTWINLGDFYPSVAYTTECITLFLASGLHKGERKLDEDEFLNLEEIPLEDVVQDIMSGKIADGKTIAAILKADKYLSTHTL